MSPLGLATGFDEEAAHSTERRAQASLASTTRACTAARIVGKYRLESLIGEGGMGAVWRAFNLQLQLPVAIKLLLPGSNTPEVEERLRLEARAVAKLVHPGIVRVFDVGETDESEPFIVMELLSGESLATVLERGPLSPVDAVQLLLPIADALALAHSRGVVHRDLKPENIFVAVEGGALQPKLLDFGIAKLTSTGPVGTPKLTGAGTLLGSPDYMSPEQALGHEDVDERSDIWSFCVVLYEALSGRVPFSASSCPALLRSIVWDDHVPLGLADGVDPKLSELVRRGLEKTPDCRFSSISELGQALASWLIEQGVQEDVTGSSVAAKWYGRQRSTPISVRNLPLTPRARHEQATLVSLAHPEVRLGSHQATFAGQPRRVPRWFPRLASVLAPVGFAAMLAAVPGLANVASAWASPAGHEAATIVVAPATNGSLTTQEQAKSKEQPGAAEARTPERSASPPPATLLAATAPAPPTARARPAKQPTTATVESGAEQELIDPYQSAPIGTGAVTIPASRRPKPSLIFP